MSEWNASNYRRRKAERLALAKPEWIVNPETGEKFCLRKVGAVASMVAGHMPSALTAEAVKGWEQSGVEGVSADVQLTEQQAKEAQRSLQFIARVVGQACVIPKLVNGPTEVEDELDVSELDDKDLMFIFRWATGQIGSVGLKGGESMNMEDLKSLVKKPSRRIRTGDNSQNLRAAS